MKIYAIIIFILTLIMVFTPLVFMGLNFEDNQDNVTTTIESNSSEDDSIEEYVSVFISDTQEVIDVKMTQYLKGCVASEIPASYELEAIKAQIIASYTYVKWIQYNADNSSNVADISDSPEEYQGYITEDEMKEKWGDNYDTYSQKIEDAIAEVYGQYLIYEDEPILTCYHAVSSGITNNSGDVWLVEYPYLTSVVATGDKLSPDYEQTYIFIADEISELISVLDSVDTTSCDEENWLSDIVITNSGFVSEINITGEIFDGNDLRYALDLASPNFDVAYYDGEFTITTYGYGHGVGMSQYSANYMARQGSSYEEILLHFFTGCELVSSF